MRITTDWKSFISATRIADRKERHRVMTTLIRGRLPVDPVKIERPKIDPAWPPRRER